MSPPKIISDIKIWNTLGNIKTYVKTYIRNKLGKWEINCDKSGIYQNK